MPHEIDRSCSSTSESRLNEPAARGGGGGPNDIGADQQIHGVGGEGRAAAAGGAVAGGGGADIQGMEGIQAAIFQDADIRRGDSGVKGQGDDIGAGGGRDNVLGVINGLGQSGGAGQSGRADGQGVKVAFGVGDRADLGTGIARS